MEKVDLGKVVTLLAWLSFFVLSWLLVTGVVPMTWANAGFDFVYVFIALFASVNLMSRDKKKD